MNAAHIFSKNDGDKTKDLYARLQTLGPAGVVALNLFRACKRSGRAKEYRSGKWRSRAYDVKEWSLSNLCRELETHAQSLGIEWGWKIDPAQPVHKWVLYVEIPTGQVSFHNEKRLHPRDYAGEWDGKPLSAERIVRWTQAVLDGLPVTEGLSETPAALGR